MNDYLPTVFDRLTEPEFRNNQCRFTFAEMEARVFRDLEDLLNTRRPGHRLFEGLPEVERSVANYGLRDLTHINSASANERQAYADHIRDTIRDFDSRLTDVEVTPRLPDDVQRLQSGIFKVSALYFRIRATLRLGQGVAEPVVFDTMFDASRGRHVVSATGDGA